jgi:hypothetical protein
MWAGLSELHVGRLVGRGRPAKRNAGFFRDRLEVGMVREHDAEIRVELAVAARGQQRFEAVRLLRNEQRQPFLRAFAVQANGYVHLHFGADALQVEDQRVQVDVEVFQVDEHRHDEETLHHVLLDLFDVDAVLGEVGRNAGYDAFLVASENRYDGRIGSGHRAVLMAAGGCRKRPALPRLPGTALPACRRYLMCPRQPRRS